eukprot:jgi/Psemu1/251539/estExt_Genewise1Plus.C_300168
MAEHHDPPSRSSRARLISNSSSNSSSSSDVLSCELESARAELEHERSLRALDAKRFAQTKQRLEQRCAFAMEEAGDSKQLMEEMQTEHEKHAEQLKRVVARTKAELRDEQRRHPPQPPDVEAAAALSEARPEVLRELNAVRIRLAETERKNRQYKRLAEDAQNTARQHAREKERARAAQKRVAQLEHELGEAVRAGAAVAEELREWKDQKDIAVLRGQEDIYKREVESLRSIVKTFDELPLTASQGGTARGKNPNPPANLRVLEVSLEAAKEEIAVLKEANGGLQADIESSVAEKEELQQKHSTVMEKFGKLRDALYAERAKAEKALERANEAEILAGKGSFNPERTRVLHMGANPLTMALKEEISVLKKQIEVLSSGDAHKKNKGSYVPSDVDPNKLHQRLKQSFKEQISRFREGVYLMTGYKVEMIPDKNDRYMFKVRSVFAERERDFLVFQWPEGKEVTSLDLLNTEYAKLLTKSPSYEYMTKFHSLPAFLASVQLTLFEKQTMI